MNKDKKSPTLKPSVLEWNKPYRATLTKANPVASGKSAYGEWNLWVLESEDIDVEERDTKKTIKGYSGEFVYFADAEFNKLLKAFTGGTKENTVVEFLAKPEKGARGPYNKLEINLVAAGSTPSGNLSYSNHKVIEHFNKLAASQIIPRTKETFVKLCKTEQFKLGDDEIESLWEVANENAQKS